MQRLSSLTLAGGLTLATAILIPGQAAMAETVPVVAEVAEGEIEGEVTVVNTEKRLLTIKKPDGHFQVIHVPEEVKRLDEVKIGDKLTISYLEAVVIDLNKGTDTGAPGAMATSEIDRESGDKPAGSLIDKVTVTGTIEAIDKAKSSVTLRGPDETLVLTLQDPALLAELAVGDSVTATFIEAVAAKVE